MTGAVKSRIERALRERFFGSPMFPAVRTAYQFAFNRGKLRNRRRMRDFYADYIHRGDLVFDVGANVGIYSEIFTELGANVIAIEPNPYCSELLRRFARNRSITVEARAVGEFPGRMTLHLSDNHQLSSANWEWVKEVQRSYLHRNAKWIGTLEVEVTTLDRLAEQFGTPSFVKVDVEGFDDRVLRGMSFKPAALTFEYNRLLPVVAARCLQTPAISSGYEFNFVNHNTLNNSFSPWHDREEFCRRVDEFASHQESADVIARRVNRR